jgi:hypothetical protein
MQRLSVELEGEVRRLSARGHGLREISRLIGRSKHAVVNVLARTPRLAAASEWTPPAGISHRMNARRSALASSEARRSPRSPSRSGVRCRRCHARSPPTVAATTIRPGAATSGRVSGLDVPSPRSCLTRRCARR